jgi:hypothetical protein
VLAPALSAPPAPAVAHGAASPTVSGSLNAAVAAAAAAAAAAGGAMPPAAAAAAAANYLAGLVTPEQLAYGGLDYNAAGAAALTGGVGGGPPRVKKTAKRTGMPRCFSSRNVPGTASSF